MDSETNKQEDFCKGCKHSNSCSEMYERIGKARGPSVAGKVFFVFLLPLLVFAGSLGLFQWLLADTITSEKARTAVSALLAVAIVMIVIYMVRYTFNRNKCQSK